MSVRSALRYAHIVLISMRVNICTNSKADRTDTELIRFNLSVDAGPKLLPILIPIPPSAIGCGLVHIQIVHEVNIYFY